MSTKRPGTPTPSAGQELYRNAPGLALSVNEALDHIARLQANNLRMRTNLYSIQYIVRALHTDVAHIRFSLDSDPHMRQFASTARVIDLCNACLEQLDPIIEQVTALYERAGHAVRAQEHRRDLDTLTRQLREIRAWLGADQPPATDTPSTPQLEPRP